MTLNVALSNKPFTITASGYSHNDVVPTSLRIQIAVPTPDTTYVIVCDGKTQDVFISHYFGLYPVAFGVFSNTFADNTWEQIGQAVAFGLIPAGWAVGDTKNITLSTNEVLTVAIYDFNHDDLQAGGKAAITFGLKNLMASTRTINSSNTNVGGFTGSAIYTWLQGDLYNSLPDDVRAIIKTVNKKTSAGNQLATINTNAMKVFLFSEIECFGTISYSVAGEGTQYPIFTDAASRIKYLANGSGSATPWWERSPNSGNATYFCSVNNSGSAYTNNATNSYGVCFGFCI
jgi:microcystin-dependent protein